METMELLVGDWVLAYRFSSRMVARVPGSSSKNQPGIAAALEV